MSVEVDGNNVQWHFKSTGHDLDYQFKVYRPGEFDSQPEYGVANVWNYPNPKHWQRHILNLNMSLPMFGIGIIPIK